MTSNAIRSGAQRERGPSWGLERQRREWRTYFRNSLQISSLHRQRPVLFVALALERSRNPRELREPVPGRPRTDAVTIDETRHSVTLCEKSTAFRHRRCCLGVPEIVLSVGVEAERQPLAYGDRHSTVGGKGDVAGISLKTVAIAASRVVRSRLTSAFDSEPPRTPPATQQSEKGAAGGSNFWDFFS